MCYPQDGAFSATLGLFALFGPASAGFTYLMNFAFKSHSNAQNFVLVSNFFATILVLASATMGFINACVAVSA